jgi:D-alanyl-D-alanine carboxypeptidase
MKKHFGRSLIVFLGLAFGISAGYFVVSGMSSLSTQVKAFVSDIDFFEQKETGKGGPNPSEIFEDKKGKDIYFLDYEKSYRISDKAPVPYLTAKAYLVGDIESGDIILSRNENKVMPIASISKLMTAIVGDEVMGLSTELKVTSEALETYGKQGRLRNGEVYTVSEMLYPLLLESSNDAAEAIAMSFGRDDFLDSMHKKAREIEMYNTHFSFNSDRSFQINSIY